MENENQTPHKRRVHYKGKYPKKFEEKYKELQPEKYKDTIAHVIQKGNTPGRHAYLHYGKKKFLISCRSNRDRPVLMQHSATVDTQKPCLNNYRDRDTSMRPMSIRQSRQRRKKRLADQGFGEDMLTIHLQNFCTIDEIAKRSGWI